MSGPFVLVIAGIDPSGGAGLHADLRTLRAVGARPRGAASALTVQNGKGVRKVVPVQGSVLREQIEALLEEERPAAVKIGMLGGREQLDVVCDLIERYRLDRVVVDPVLRSTSGARLFDRSELQRMRERLLPLATLLTPNVGELSELSGSRVSDEESMHDAIAAVRRKGAALLVKGGHANWTRSHVVTDVLVDDEGEARFHGPRVESPDTRGTGCFLASTIAGGLAAGRSIRESIEVARGLLSRALLLPVRQGEAGFPDAHETIHFDRSHAGRLARVDGLYVITDSAIGGRLDVEAQARAALAGGATVIQYREKSERTGEREVAVRLRRLCHDSGALFIVNDSVPLALAVEADGVHLGPDDMEPGRARDLLGPDRLIGVSVANGAEAARAAAFASYFGVGAIYGSTSKPDAGTPIGVEAIRSIAADHPAIPVVAIGGIAVANIAETARAGARAAAVISAVVAASEPAEAAALLTGRFLAGRVGRPSENGGSQ